MMIDRVTCIHNLYSDVVNVTKNLETNTYKAFDKDNTAMIFWLKNRAGWVDKQETNTTIEQRHIIDLSRIDNEQLAQLERVLEQSVTGTSKSREIPKVIEGVHEG